MAHGGLALHRDVRLVVVDVEDRLGGVLDAPHDDRGDLDRVAALVVDLELVAVEGAGPQRDLVARETPRGLRRRARPTPETARLARRAGRCRRRVAPVEADLARGAAVVAEQDQHARLVGLEREVAVRGEDRQDERDDAGPDHPGDRVVVACGVGRALGRREVEQHRTEDVQGDRDREHRPAGQDPGLTFGAHLDSFAAAPAAPAGAIACDIAMISPSYRSRKHRRGDGPGAWRRIDEGGRAPGRSPPFELVLGHHRRDVDEVLLEAELLSPSPMARPTSWLRRPRARRCQPASSGLDLDLAAVQVDLAERAGATITASAPQSRALVRMRRDEVVDDVLLA